MTVFLALVLAAPSALCAPSVPSFHPFVSNSTTVASGALSAPADDADEDAQAIAGFAKRDMNGLVVREAKSFLERYPSHRLAPAVRFHLADAYFSLGKPAEAAAEFKALDGISGFEQAVEVKFRLGQCLLESNEAAEAATYLAAAAEGTRTNAKAAYLRPAATYLLGEAHFRSGKFAEARAAYSDVLKLPDHGGTYARDARYGITWSAFEADEFDATVAAADEFLKSHATDDQAGDIAFIAAEAQVAAGRPADAFPWYSRVKTGRYAEAAMRGAAFAEVEREQFGRAAQRFTAYLNKYPEGEFAAESALQAGVQLVRAKDFAGALTALAHPAAKKDAQQSYWTALAHAGQDQHEAALNSANEGLKRSPDEALAVQLRIAAGDALFELGREAEAAALYEASGSSYALHAAAVARLNAGDEEEAARLAERLLSGGAREPGSEYRGEALLTNAEALFRLKRYQEAETVLRKLLSEVRPGADGAPAATALPAGEVARATSRLGWCRWYGDDSESARALFQRVASDEAARPIERQEAQFMAARASLKAGDEPAAKTGFTSYLNAAPQGPFVAEALLRLGRLTPGAEGAALFEQIVADHGSSEVVAAALSELADRRVALEDPAGAADAYRAITERFPNDPVAFNARYGLGWSLYSAGKFKEAAEPLWAVAGADGADETMRTASYELLVWVEAGAENSARAAEAFNGLLARTDDAGRIMKAARATDTALTAAKNTDGRKALWESVTAKLRGPELGRARIEQGFASLDRGEAEDAARHALAARQLLPEDAGVCELLYFVGEAYFEKGDDERAAPLYAAASAHGSPEVAERALYKSGFSELRRGKNTDAAAAFAALVERFPRGVLAPESMFLAGEALFRDGKTKESAEWLRRMTTSAPKHASRAKALFRLGVAEGTLENWSASAAALADLLANHKDFPNSVEAELWRGRSLSRLDQRRGARQSLSRVVESDEGILAAQARIEIGRLHEKENDLEGAVAEYLKVAVLYGHDEECAEALVRAGDVLAAKGDAKLAKARYEEVASDYPKTEWAETAKARLADSK